MKINENVYDIQHECVPIRAIFPAETLQWISSERAACHTCPITSISSSQLNILLTFYSNVFADVVAFINLTFCKDLSGQMTELFMITLLSMTLLPIHATYQSYLHLSSLGFEFQPRHSVQLLLETTFQTRLTCATSCSLEPSCRAIDYDSSSHRCRFFEGDLTTGSIVASTSATSVVGTMVMCQESHDKTCDANTCQCRPHSFWNNSTCAMQLFENDTCSQVGSCRSDLNLTCAADFIGRFSKCDPGK